MNKQIKEGRKEKGKKIKQDEWIFECLTGKLY